MRVFSQSGLVASALACKHFEHAPILCNAGAQLWTVAFCMMPRSGAKPKSDPLALDGLAKVWEKNRGIRGGMLSTGNLLRWA